MSSLKKQRVIQRIIVVVLSIGLTILYFNLFPYSRSTREYPGYEKQYTNNRGGRPYGNYYYGYGAGYYPRYGRSYRHGYDRRNHYERGDYRRGGGLRGGK